MSCNLEVQQDGQIRIVADNGKPSILFEQAKQFTGNQELASDIWGVGNSQQYKELYTEPQIAEYQSKLSKKLNLLPSVQENMELVIKGKSKNISKVQIEKTASVNGVNYIATADSVPLAVLSVADNRDNGVKFFNVKVYNQGKLETLEGKNIDTQLYKKAIEDSISQGNPFLSKDQIFTGIFQRKGNMFEVSPYPQNIDANREPALEDVVRYINQESVTEPLSNLEKTQLKTDLLNTDISDSDELKSILNTAFFPAPTRDKLNKAGIYTVSEIDNILRDTELQNRIKNFALKLNNTEETIEKYDEADSRFFSGSGTNSFGKIQIDNPYINQQEAIDVLGGIEEDMFGSVLQNSDFDYLKSQENLFPYFNQFKKVTEKTFTGTSLSNKPKTDTLQLFDQVLKEDENGAVRGRISRLLNVHPFAWETSPEEVKTLLKGLDRDALKIGMDLKNLEDFYEDRTPQEIKDFLADLSLTLSTGNINEFAPIYNSFFGIDTSVKVSTEKLSQEDQQKNLFKVTSDSPAYIIFRETGLIPIGNDLYQRTDALKKDLPALYEILDARTGLKEEDIQQDIKNIDLSNVEETDAETLQKMAIYARLFNSKLDNTKDVISAEEDQYIKFEEVDGDFVADFYSKQLSEQRKNSEDYQNFYSKFEIGDNGISLISPDPITVEQVSSQIEIYPKLANYFNAKINSELRFPGEIDEDMDDSYLRQYYGNYPKALDMYQDAYQEINPGLIEAQSKEPFIRTAKGVFELSAILADKSVYQKLLQNRNTQYKNYNLNSSPDYQMIPSAVKEEAYENKLRNLFSKSESEEINTKLTCN